MSWKSIRLELGCTGEFPSGSVSRAYLLRLPLDDQEAIDANAFERDPQKATVRRHWSTEADERGHVLRDGRDWVLQCNAGRRTLRFESPSIRLGDQISLMDVNGDALPFRIASIR